MKRDIIILHAHGALGWTKVVYDDDTPGDIIIDHNGAVVDSAIQCFIEETNLDPVNCEATVTARNEYKQVTIPISKLAAAREQTTEQFFRELWGDDVYDTEALSRDW